MKEPSRKQRSAKAPAGASNKRRIKRVVSQEVLTGWIYNHVTNSDWDSIIDMLEAMLEDDRRDHWLRLELAMAYQRKSDYDNALKHARLSLGIAPDCAMTQWIVALTHLARGEFKEASEMAEGLINRSSAEIMHGPCGNGSDCDLHTAQAETIINDSRMLMSIYYCESGYQKLSCYFLTMYKRNVAKGIGTMLMEC